jgi:LPXTG-site transpeptidase (sortase) family protein
MNGRLIFARLGILLSILFLAACQGAVPPTATLPPPHVILVSPSPASTIQPTSTATVFAQDIGSLAQTKYGDRLIRYITIQSLNLLAPVTPVGWQTDWEGNAEPQWDSPDAQVGWAINSALPGDDGNIILYGHNNIDSSVFLHLYQLKSGDTVQLQTGVQTWDYTVSEVTIFEATDPAADQAIFDKYMKATRSPRLTILSCYPPDNNTHRVVVIAYPNLP